MPEPDRERAGPRLKNRPLIHKFRDAFAGIAAAWRRESNFRREVVCAVAAVVVLIALRPGLVWWALTVLVIALVLAAETLNATLEALIDRLHPDLHPSIKTIKDMAAAIVLLTSLGAAAVGLLLVLSIVIDG